MPEQTSSLIEEIPSEQNTDKTQTIGGASSGSYTILLALIVICLVLFLMFHAYSCFCINQEIEPYINEQPRTDVQVDKEFDVDNEVEKLIQTQEEYLEKLQRSRIGNN